MYRSGNFTVDNQMRNPHFAFNFGMLGNNQHARLLGFSNHITFDVPINPQATLEIQIAFDLGRNADQAVDGAFVFVSKHDATSIFFEDGIPLDPLGVVSPLELNSVPQCSDQLGTE